MIISKSVRYKNVYIYIDTYVHFSICIYFNKCAINILYNSLYTYIHEIHGTNPKKKYKYILKYTINK